MSVQLSAGIIITDGLNITLGHSCGNKFWDLPKGLVDEGEDNKIAAIRETKEEFGITVPENELTDLGILYLHKTKDINLYVWKVTEMPDITKCKCVSYYTNHWGRRCREVDDWQNFEIEESLLKMNKHMRKLFLENFITNNQKLKFI